MVIMVELDDTNDRDAALARWNHGKKWSQDVYGYRKIRDQSRAYCNT
jgi:hypothetical protein